MERMGRRVELRENKAWGSVLAGLMGEDGEARRSFITRNAKDVRFLDV